MDVIGTIFTIYFFREYRDQNPNDKHVQCYYDDTINVNERFTTIIIFGCWIFGIQTVVDLFGFINAGVKNEFTTLLMLKLHSICAFI